MRRLSLVLLAVFAFGLASRVARAVNPYARVFPGSGLPSAGILADWKSESAPNAAGVMTGTMTDSIGQKALAPTGSPVFTSSVMGWGHASIRFDGSTSYMLNATLSHAQPLECWIVVKLIAWVQNHYVVGGVGPTLITQGTVTPHLALYAGTGITPEIAVPLGSFAIVRGFWNGASSLIYVNGVAATSAANSGTNAFGPGFGVAAYTDASGKSNIEIARLLFVDPSASGYSAAALLAALERDYFSTLVVGGDSIPVGYGLTTPSTQTWPAVAGGSLPGYWPPYPTIAGVSGQPVGGTIHPNSAGTCISGGATHEDVYTATASWQKHIVMILEGGSNDLSFGTSAATLKTYVQTYWTARLAAAPNIVPICMTLLPRTWLTDTYGTFAAKEAQRVLYNADLLANTATYGCTFVIDQTTVTGAADPTNGTYYYNPDIGGNNGVHPTAALHANIAALVASSLTSYGLTP
jgi:lysophospholipase L1-like esterase